MQRQKPDYFEIVRRKAQQRWNKLERDPENRGVWLHLFRQIQSPRHVLSELLQNADDAGAKWARADINEGIFCFQHNGEDFDKDSLGALCKFGLSNKRHLHTIGFRGIGFKSVFSLGPRVEVSTPSLAIAFEHQRFTQPIWLDDAPQEEWTSIRVNLVDTARAKALTDSLQAWIASAVPLLFFRSIECLEIMGEVITRQVEALGPVNRSEWVNLNSKKAQRVLHIISPEEPFPTEALAEIRDERLTLDVELPPCKVELVLGLTGPQRVYVVLPTEMELPLPFSVNAPFIQDPDRKSIKDPRTSFTNRWMLKRIGDLLATTLREWLGEIPQDLSERAQAYDLLPTPIPDGDSAGLVCARMAVNAFRQEISGAPLLLADTGELVDRKHCLELSGTLLKVWESWQLLELFGPNKTHFLAPAVSEKNRRLLESWGWLERTDSRTVFERLKREPYPPRPQSPESLYALWAFLSRVESWQSTAELAVIPTLGRTQLFPKKSIVVAEPGRKVSPQDWDMLLNYLLIVEDAWLTPLEQDLPEGSPTLRFEAQNFYRRLDLQQIVSLERALELVSARLFATAEPGHDGITLAQIAARADLKVPANFRYLCQDGHWRNASEVLSMAAGQASFLLPANLVNTGCVSDIYAQSLNPKDRKTWENWLSTTKSGLRRFPMPDRKSKNPYQDDWDSEKIQAFVIERSFEKPYFSFPYSRKGNYFVVDDFDFSHDLWVFWESISVQNPQLWVEVFWNIAQAWSEEWEARSHTTVKQCYALCKSITNNTLRAQWLQKFRTLPCLQDISGNPALPEDLLHHTDKTAQFGAFERLIDRRYETPGLQKLLDLLGVRKQLQSIDRLLELIRAQSRSKTTDFDKLAESYRALDMLYPDLPMEEKGRIKGVFLNEPLIFDQEGRFQGSRDLYQGNPQDIPGMLTIHPRIPAFSLWNYLDIQKSPTREQAFEWLSNLRYKSLSIAERKRVIQILKREPKLVWQKCHRWLTLEGNTEYRWSFKWKTTRGRDGDDLESWVKRVTADLSMLAGEDASLALFEQLNELTPALEQHLEITGEHRGPEPDWLRPLAYGLWRVHLPNTHSSYQDAAMRLGRSSLVRAKRLEVTPYLEGRQAGKARSCKAYWQGTQLFVVGPETRHHDDLVAEIQTAFEASELHTAIAACVHQSPEWIESYFAENFTLREDTANVEWEKSFSQKLDNAPLQEELLAEPDVADMVGAQPTVAKVESPSVPIASPISNDMPNLNEGGFSTRKTRNTSKGQGRTPAPRQTPTRDQLLEAFFNGQGFRWDAEHGYFVDGAAAKICRDGEVFDWVHYDSHGNVMRRYWVGEQSLVRGVEIPAEIWDLLKSSPDNVALLLPHEQSLRAHDGRTLMNLEQAQILQVFQSAYRLWLSDANPEDHSLIEQDE